MIAAIKSRVDILSKSKKLPAGLDQAKFDGAKSGLAEITKTWEEASQRLQGRGPRRRGREGEFRKGEGRRDHEHPGDAGSRGGEGLILGL